MNQIPNPEAPNPQLPVVQRLRVRYAKRGRLRFTSHRDFARAFERAVRRAGIPIGFSSGFSPHPKISYANAAPTGSASEAEFLEIGLTEPRTAGRGPARARRGAAARARHPRRRGGRRPGLAGGPSRGQRVAHRVGRRGPGPGGSRRWLRSSAAEDVSVDRMTKRGLRAIDVRGAVVAPDRRRFGGHRCGSIRPSPPSGRTTSSPVCARTDSSTLARRLRSGSSRDRSAEPAAVRAWETRCENEARRVSSWQLVRYLGQSVMHPPDRDALHADRGGQMNRRLRPKKPQTFRIDA